MMFGKKRKEALDDPHVFIAYASEDREKAEAIRSYIKRASNGEINVFMDIDAPIWERFRLFLPKQIKKSRVVLVLWSKSFVSKDYPMDEVRIAGKQNKIFGVEIDALNDDELYGYGQSNRINLTKWSVGDDDLLLGNLIEELRDYLELKGKIYSFNISDEHEGGDVFDDELKNNEDLLIRTINRGEMTKIITNTLDKSDHQWPIFLVKCCCSDWIEAFADHVMVRQIEGDYSALESESLNDYKAIPLGTNNNSAGRYPDTLIKRISSPGEDFSSNSGKINALTNWLSNGEPKVRVIHTILNRDTFENELTIYVDEVNKLFELLPINIREKYKVVVVFSCLDDDSNELDRMEVDGATWLDNPRKITRQNIYEWVQNFPPSISKIYNGESICRKMAEEFSKENGGSSSFYEELIGSLECAVKTSRK